MDTPPARGTTMLVGTTVLAYAILTLTGYARAAINLGGFIPARVAGLLVDGAVPVWLTPITSLMLHGGLLHLGMNMVMLAFCGRQVEPAIGTRGVALLYLAGAYAAAAAQWAWSPHDTTPVIGASGAISAVLAAYALLYGERRLRVAHAGMSRWLNVAWLATAWIGINLLIGVATRDGDFRVAIPAHIGGFVTGLLLTRPLLAWRFGRRATA